MTAYFQSISVALGNVDELVVAGPSATKFEFEKHLGTNAKPLFLRLIGTENVAHANDSDILKIARHYFKVPKSMAHSSYIAGL